MLVAIINTDGTVESKEIDGSLESMQAIVGGLIQPVDLEPTATVWVNEEGLLLGMEPNRIATDLANEFGIQTRLVGTAFLTGGIDEDGNTLGANPEHIRVLKGYSESLLLLG
jgi:hypothetical protein